MVNAFNFTDFLYRPRRPEELDTQRGGGVIFNQAPHQVDILRLLGGGRLASVRACAGSWDAARPTQGAYTAFFTFENGCCASLTYSGYAHFDSDELCGWFNELGEPKDQSAYGGARRALAAVGASDEELALKTSRNYGGARYAGTKDRTPPAHQHFGFVLASCEGADLRPGPTGVAIYGHERVMFEACPVSDIPRREVIDELHAAMVYGRPLIHDGEWGLATMEACIAILASSNEGREIRLEHQVGLRDG
jgi:phthalate 4,5-cis-dihydrodiol dehydrogenase